MQASCGALKTLLNTPLKPTGRPVHIIHHTSHLFDMFSDGQLVLYIYDHSNAAGDVYAIDFACLGRPINKAHKIQQQFYFKLDYQF